MMEDRHGTVLGHAHRQVCTERERSSGRRASALPPAVGAANDCPVREQSAVGGDDGRSIEPSEPRQHGGSDQFGAVEQRVEIVVDGVGRCWRPASRHEVLGGDEIDEVGIVRGDGEQRPVPWIEARNTAWATIAATPDVAQLSAPSRSEKLASAIDFHLVVRLMKSGSPSSKIQMLPSERRYTPTPENDADAAAMSAPFIPRAASKSPSPRPSRVSGMEARLISPNAAPVAVTASADSVPSNSSGVRLRLGSRPG
jgi:hypothetical protein